jgi:DNA-binding response OmpR family regulator
MRDGEGDLAQDRAVVLRTEPEGGLGRTGFHHGEREDPISMTWPQYLRRECSFNGNRIHLTPSQAELLGALLIRRGRTVSNEALIETLYPDPFEAPERDEDCMKVLLSLLRRKLPGLVHLEHGRGYFIPKPRPAEFARAA